MNSTKGGQNSRLARFLGLYLIAVAFVEVGTAFAVTQGYSRIGLLRLGVLLVLPGWLPRHESTAMIVEVISAMWLLALGVLFVLSKLPLRTYVLSEVILSLPTLHFVLTMLIEGGSHLFPLQDAVSLLIVLLALSMAPLTMAIMIMKSRKKDVSIPSGSRS